MLKNKKQKSEQKEAKRPRNEEHIAVLTIDVTDNEDYTIVPQKNYSRIIPITQTQHSFLIGKDGYKRMIQTLVGNTDYSAYISFLTTKRPLTWIKRPNNVRQTTEPTTIGLPPSSANLSTDLKKVETPNLQVKFEEPLIESTNYQEPTLKRARVRQITDK